VVISGGEPIIQSNLHVFIRELKERSQYVKLDTNGTNPYAIKSLIEEKLVDLLLWI
jgi:pyruvate formate lyase activating enzyme